MDIVLINLVESHLPAYKDAGDQYVTIYRHRLEYSLMFVESYKNWQKYNESRKYWLNEGYTLHRLYDLDYGDYIREQNV